MLHFQALERRSEGSRQKLSQLQAERGLCATIHLCRGHAEATADDTEKPRARDTTYRH